MKKLLLIIVSAMMLAGSSVVLADISIGVLNMQEVMRTIPQVKAMQKKLKNQFGPQQKKLIAQQKQLQTDVKNFEKNSAVMTDADKQKLQQKIIKQQQDLQKAQTDFRTQISAAQNKAMQKIFAQIGKVVNRVAADQKLNLIVTKASAVYNDASMDVTDSVIKGLK